MNQLDQPASRNDHVLGPWQAPVTLVEFGDYECAQSGRAHLLVLEVLRLIGDDLRFVFRHFPLSQSHPHALLAAQSAEAAGAQGRYWPMHHTLFQNQTELAVSDLLSYAEALDLDVPRFAHELHERVHLPTVMMHFQSGVRSGVNGTPTFFINGARYDGAWYDVAGFTLALQTAFQADHRPTTG